MAKDEQCIVAEKCGSIHGLSSSGVKLFLKDVLFVPEWRDNLISVSKLVKAGLDIQFSKTNAIIKKDGYEIAVANLRGGLYEIGFGTCWTTCI